MWLEKQGHKSMLLKLLSPALLASIVLILGIKTKGNFGKLLHPECSYKKVQH